MNRTGLSLAVCFAMICSLALGQDAAKTDWKVIEGEPADPAAKKSKARAIQARDALFERLSKRLTQVAEADGPAAAIAVCQDEAPKIATEVAKEQGVKIGRTALKLRNQANRPPVWADALISKSPTEPVFLSGPGGELGALLPIRLKAQCLTCHGPARSLPVPVRVELARRYPNDRATGFAEGDLRGWFWVEVPR